MLLAESPMMAKRTRGADRGVSFARSTTVQRRYPTLGRATSIATDRVLAASARDRATCMPGHDCATSRAVLFCMAGASDRDLTVDGIEMAEFVWLLGHAFTTLIRGGKPNLGTPPSGSHGAQDGRDAG
jgi:hypothetical protein